MTAVSRATTFLSGVRRNPGEPAAKEEQQEQLGDLPEWQLADLYEGMDSPRLQADLEGAESDSKTSKPLEGQSRLGCRQKPAMTGLARR